jgi:hypothetical protein
MAWSTVGISLAGTLNAARLEAAVAKSERVKGVPCTIDVTLLMSVAASVADPSVTVSAAVALSMVVRRVQPDVTIAVPAAAIAAEAAAAATAMVEAILDETDPTVLDRLDRPEVTPLWSILVSMTIEPSAAIKPPWHAGSRL